VPPMLTRREVARRLNRPVDYVSGAIEALKIPPVQLGNAFVITEAQFRKLAHLARPEKRTRAAS